MVPSSSCPAIAGKGGRGAGGDAAQALPRIHDVQARLLSFCFDSDAPSTAQTRGPPPPLSRGRISDLVLAAHFFARAMPSQSHEQISEPDLRQMAPAVDPAAITITLCKLLGGFRGCHRFAPSGLYPPYKRKKGKRNAERRRPVSSALACGARLARRARLPAFHHGSCLRESVASQRLSLRPCFSGNAAPIRAGVHPAAPARLQRRTSRAGHSAGGLMPEAARERR